MLITFLRGGNKFFSYSSYRQIADPALSRFIEGDSPVLGQYIAVYKEGPVKMGDEVFISI